MTTNEVEGRLTKALADNAELRTLLPARRARSEDRAADEDAIRAEERAARRRQAPEVPLVWDEPLPPPAPHVGEASDEEFEEIAYKHKKRGATRISDDLPRETTTIALPEAERRCPCCNEVMCKDR